ncbi:hypothetical protein D9757_010293 [Collybiopsis confluens]|uniref:Uncharacterized protein n=1 Tax=Collybiopsis confluens TaxID=2823264 RepID=A0A8H5GU90_9AGAR|nr:hypothetical protein D9757_009879 [Collybiopsis confluens]KAF5371041.1 hypothetical protein D9757_010293 [Collybiopsis confluens]
MVLLSLLPPPTADVHTLGAEPRSGEVQELFRHVWVALSNTDYVFGKLRMSLKYVRVCFEYVRVCFEFVWVMFKLILVGIPPEV